ncbi:MAG TPA: hypothetical protein VE242_10345, partial [Chthoniobacterales bacterium]|nr:hypothetical protein [Chthoniobacterales bacterium]
MKTVAAGCASLLSRDDKIESNSFADNDLPRIKKARRRQPTPLLIMANSSDLQRLCLELDKFQ